MKQKEQYLNEIKEIRLMMEQSSRFLSLSGLSGILVGIYALAGAYFARRMLQNTEAILVEGNRELLISMVILATSVMLLSFFTVLYLTYRKTRRESQKIRSKGIRLLAVNLAIPLISGGIFTLVILARGYYEMVAPSLLIFYGLALLNASKFTRKEIFYMGLIEILAGIAAAIFSDYGLILWAFGFGIVHVFYGVVMHFRYDFRTKTEES